MIGMLRPVSNNRTHERPIYEEMQKNLSIAECHCLAKLNVEERT